MKERLLAASIMASMWLVAAQPVLAHEERVAGRYTLLVGLIGEPFFQGSRSGFEFWLTDAGRRVGGADRTLRADVIREGVTRSLGIIEREDAGHYEAAFSAPAEASYELRIVGTIEGQSIDESFQFRIAPRGGGATTAEPVRTISSAPDLVQVALGVTGAVVVVALAIGLTVLARRTSSAAASISDAEPTDE